MAVLTPETIFFICFVSVISLITEGQYIYLTVCVCPPPDLQRQTSWLLCPPPLSPMPQEWIIYCDPCMTMRGLLRGPPPALMPSARTNRNREHQRGEPPQVSCSRPCCRSANRKPEVTRTPCETGNDISCSPEDEPTQDQTEEKGYIPPRHLLQIQASLWPAFLLVSSP